MADQKVTYVMRLCDSTTLTQGAAVDNGNLHVDLMRVANTALLTGNGATGAGSPRVTIADDNSPLPVKIDQTTPGTTNLVAADITKIAGAAVVTGAAGLLKVAIADSTGQAIALGQAAMAASVPVVLASDQAALNVTIGLPTNPAWDITNLTTPVNLAAGASGDATSADLPSKFLRQLVVSGSVAFKVVLSVVNDAVVTNKVVLFGGPGNNVVYAPPHQNYLATAAAGAGVQGWRASITNEDISEVADFYTTFLYADN